MLSPPAAHEAGRAGPLRPASPEGGAAAKLPRPVAPADDVIASLGQQPTYKAALLNRGNGKMGGFHLKHAAAFSALLQKWLIDDF